jgi:hypothetical protein
LKSLLRSCRLGHLGGVGKGLGDRKRITLVLRHVFGDTFAETAYFYKNPDPKAFIACLLHVASDGRVRVDADISALFVQMRKGKAYHVDLDVLLGLGCTRRALFETLRRTPGGPKDRHRPENAAPLIIPSPNELMNVSTLAPQQSPSQPLSPTAPEVHDNELVRDDADALTYSPFGLGAHVGLVEFEVPAAELLETVYEPSDDALGALLLKEEEEIGSEPSGALWLEGFLFGYG